MSLTPIHDVDCFNRAVVLALGATSYTDFTAVWELGRPQQRLGTDSLYCGLPASAKRALDNDVTHR
jgi:hypothetical protein